MSDPSRKSDSPAPASSPASAGRPLLATLWPLSAVALFAHVVGGLVARALPGSGVGLGGLIRVTEVAGGASAHVLLMALVVTLVGLVMALSRSRAAWPLRVSAIAVGGYVTLVGMASAASRGAPSGISGGLFGAGIAVVALLAAWEASRSPFARAFAVALGAAALGSLVRLLAVALAFAALERSSAGLATAARASATAALALEVMVVLMGLGLLGRRKGSTSTVSLPALGVLGTTLGLTQLALAGAGDAPSVASAFLHRVAELLALRPPPFGPAAIGIFVGLVGPILAVALLVARRPIAPLAAIMALLLIARTTPERPLAGLMLFVASAGLALAARHERALWAVLDPPKRATKPTSAPAARSAQAERKAGTSDGDERATTRSTEGAN